MDASTLETIQLLEHEASLMEQQAAMYRRWVADLTTLHAGAHTPLTPPAMPPGRPPVTANNQWGKLELSQRKLLLGLHRQNWTDYAIAKHLRVSISTVKYHIAKAKRNGGWVDPNGGRYTNPPVDIEIPV